MDNYLKIYSTKELIEEIKRRNENEIEVLQTSYPNNLYVSSRDFDKCYKKEWYDKDKEMTVIVIK